VHTVYLDSFYIDIHESDYMHNIVIRSGNRTQRTRGIYYVNGSWQSGFKPWSDPNFNGDDHLWCVLVGIDAKAYADWAGKRCRQRRNGRKRLGLDLLERNTFGGQMASAQIKQVILLMSS